MVKHVEGMKLSKNVDGKHKICVRSFPSANVKCMKHSMKPCIRENNLDNVIIHIGTNESDYERQPKMTAKFVIDVVKNMKTNTITVSISGILQQNGNNNNANEEVPKMCREAKLDFIMHKSITPRTDLNKSRLHLCRNGSVKIGKNFVNFILKYYK